MDIGFAVCSYNRPFELKRCLHTLFQTTRHIANSYYLLIDNCSPLISQTDLLYYKYYLCPPVKITRLKQNKGITEAFNLACYLLSKKKCDIFFVINDDISFRKKGWVEKYIQAHTDSGIHHFNFMDGRNLIGRESFNNSEITYHNWVRGCMEVLSQKCYVASGGYRKCFRDLGCMDTDLSDRIIEKGFTNTYLQQLLSYCKLPKYPGHYNMGFCADVEGIRKYVVDHHLNMGIANSNSYYDKKSAGFLILKNERHTRSKHLLSLVYHHILDTENESCFPKDFGVTRTDQFKAQIEALLEMGYSFINLSQLLSKENFPDKACILTFDDGYYSIYQNVYPFLKTKGIPAACFLTTNFLGKKTLLPYHEFLWLLSRCKDEKVIQELAKTANIKSKEDLSMHIRLKSSFRFSMSPKKQKEAIEFLKKEIEHSACPDKNFYLSWKQAQAMQNVFEFGAHTVTHPQLSRLKSSDVRKEVSRSKKEIQKHLGRADWFAYPYGYASAFNKTVVEIVKQEQFLLEFKTEPRKNRFPFQNLFSLGRFSPDRLTGSCLKKSIELLK